ncbi:MAG TPA: hypothetical protein VKT49_03320, partial [Bryobacteraceae bacterium]|nr:hypothetical protein [Bryobacteraceae bacterium]
MRGCWWILLFPGLLAAQAAAPAGVLRGILLERDPQTAAGEFSVRAADSQVFRFLFDGKSYVERDQQPIDVSRLQPGEMVEVVSDEARGSLLRYARSIHVLPSPAPPRALSQGRYRAYRNSADRLMAAERAIPTGTMAVAGVVFQLNGDHVVLHTRDAGDQTILLRKDTRYLADGALVGSDELKPNMR